MMLLEQATKDVKPCLNNERQYFQSDWEMALKKNDFNFQYKLIVTSGVNKGYVLIPIPFMYKKCARVNNNFGVVNII